MVDKLPASNIPDTADPRYVIVGRPGWCSVCGETTLSIIGRCIACKRPGIRTDTPLETAVDVVATVPVAAAVTPPAPVPPELAPVPPELPLYRPPVGIFGSPTIIRHCRCGTIIAWLADGPPARACGFCGELLGAA